MYTYKLKAESRLWRVFDKDMNLDPYDFFSSENIEHWTHINDDDGCIDLYWPTYREPVDNVLDTICSKCNYWYGMYDGEHVSQCPKCGNIDYYD